MRKILAALAFLVLAPCCAAFAQDTTNVSITSSSTWTDLGTGPMRVELLNGIPVTLVVSPTATTPTTGLHGHQINVNQKFMDFQTTDDVWAVVNSASPATLAVTSLTGLNGGNLVGNVSNATSGVGTSSTNVGSVSWIYGFNGTTWDQLRSLGTPNFSLSIDTPTTNSNLYSAITGPIPAGTNTIGSVGLASTTTGGATQYHHYSVATSGGDTQNIKNAAGTVYSIDWYSTTATAMEIKLYDLSSAPTCSSATGVVGNFLIPANTAAPGAHLPWAVGKAFTTGISYCIVAAGAPQADTDAGTPATGVSLMVDYK